MDVFKDRNLLLAQFSNNLIICEIGVFKGEFSKFIFNNLNPLELHLIDPFDGTMCSGDKDGNNIVWTDLNREYTLLKDYFLSNKNVILHKGYSHDVLKSFNDEYFDLIYIDGDHSYNGVKKDLNLSKFKIKKGGLICGHDYTDNMFPDVVKAVNEFCQENGLIINYLTEDKCPSFCIKIT